jgi:WD40 repeat protein
MVWRYPSMHRVATLNGHSGRVLFLAMSPDNRIACTASEDESLRFWRPFDRKQQQQQQKTSIRLGEGVEMSKRLTRPLPLDDWEVGTKVKLPDAMIR